MKKINHTKKTKAKCEKCANHAIWSCFWGNVFLTLFKGFLGAISGSLALIADAIHSGADVLNSIVSIIAARIGKKPADISHPYGHGMAEFLSGVFVGGVLLIGAFFIFFTSFAHLLQKTPLPPPDVLALVGAFMSIATNELLFHFAHCAAVQVNSPAIDAQAWDNRSDAFSSIPVFIGVLGSQLGFPILDPIAALFVGVLVGKVAFEIFFKNIKALMDNSLSNKEKRKIKEIVLSQPSVEGLNSLRSRGIGRYLWVDLQIILSGNKSVNETNEIVAKIKEDLFRQITNLAEVTVICVPKEE